MPHHLQRHWFKPNVQRAVVVSHSQTLVYIPNPDVESLRASAIPYDLNSFWYLLSRTHGD